MASCLTPWKPFWITLYYYYRNTTQMLDLKNLHHCMHIQHYETQKDKWKYKVNRLLYSTFNQQLNKFKQDTSVKAGMISIIHRHNTHSEIHVMEWLWPCVFSPDVQHENRSNKQQWHHQDRHRTPRIWIKTTYCVKAQSKIKYNIWK